MKKILGIASVLLLAAGIYAATALTGDCCETQEACCATQEACCVAE